MTLIYLLCWVPESLMRTAHYCHHPFLGPDESRVSLISSPGLPLTSPGPAATHSSSETREWEWPAGGCGGPALYLGPHLFLRGRLGYRPGRMLGRAGMWLSCGCLDVGQCVTRVMPGQPRPDTGASTGRRGGCGRPALHALVSDLWT